jgi:osmoprotectant transport system substrate-binding protein
MLVATTVLASCGDGDGDDPASTVPPVVTINVGRTTDPLSQLLAEIYGQRLENSGFRVGRKDPVADRATLLAQMADGRVQLTGDLSATLLGSLDADGVVADVDGQLAALGDALPGDLVVSGGAATAASGALALACSTGVVDDASEGGAEDTSALLTAVADGLALRLAVTPQVESAPVFGLDAFLTTYSDPLGGEIDTVVGDDPAAAVAEGDADCALTSVLDPAVVTEGLVVLADDLGFAAADAVVPVLTAAANTPDVVAALTQINAALDTATLRALLVKVERGDGSFESIAKQFVASLPAPGGS